MSNRPRYTNELAALNEYIARFQPEEFSTSAPLDRPPPEKLAEARRIKARLRHKRRLAAALTTRLANLDFTADEAVLTQAEVDALLAKWTP